MTNADDNFVEQQQPTVAQPTGEMTMTTATAPKTKKRDRAESVSLTDFALAYFRTQRNGGTIVDLMEATGIKNMQTANQKLVKLREQYTQKTGLDLPKLARRPRSASDKESVGEQAVSLLAQLFREHDGKKGKK